MRVICILSFLIFSFSAFANITLQTKVHDIDYGSQPTDEILIFFNSGHVAKISEDNLKLLKLMTEDKGVKVPWLEFELDNDRNVLGFKIIPDVYTDQSPKLTSENATYIPTTVASMEVAKKYFKEAPLNPKDSQCFNRAMVWSHGWWKNHSTKSMKLYIFFTRSYIRKYNFEWWFHVAPYFHIMDNGKVVERMMDIKYSSRPLPFRDWSNLFMKNDAQCPVITKYSEYADYPYTGDCFILRENMYSYQPSDLQMNEAWGYVKDKFNMDEVRAAYLEAFDIKY